MAKKAPVKKKTTAKKAPAKKAVAKKAPAKKVEAQKAPAPPPAPAEAPVKAKVRPVKKAECSSCGRPLNAANEPHTDGVCGICKPRKREQRSVVPERK